MAPPAVAPFHVPLSPVITVRFRSPVGTCRVVGAFGVSDCACHKQLTAVSRRLRPIRPPMRRLASCSTPANMRRLSKSLGTMPHRIIRCQVCVSASAGISSHAGFAFHQQSEFHGPACPVKSETSSGPLSCLARRRSTAASLALRCLSVRSATRAAVRCCRIASLALCPGC